MNELMSILLYQFGPLTNHFRKHAVVAGVAVVAVVAVADDVVSEDLIVHLPGYDVVVVHVLVLVLY